MLAAFVDFDDDPNWRAKEPAVVERIRQLRCVLHLCGRARATEHMPTMRARDGDAWDLHRLARVRACLRTCVPGRVGDVT